MKMRVCTGFLKWLCLTGLVLTFCPEISARETVEIPAGEAVTLIEEEEADPLTTDSIISSIPAGGKHKKAPESIIDNHPRGRFRWGADVGSSLDMTGSDQSSFDIALCLGFSRKWINFIGAGAEAAFCISSSTRTFPIYANFRTNFKNTPSIVFWDVKGGICLTYPGNSHQHTGAYASTGIGFYLARSSTFSSHILVSYTFRENRPEWTPLSEAATYRDLHMACVKIGVMF